MCFYRYWNQGWAFDDVWRLNTRAVATSVCTYWSFVIFVSFAIHLLYSKRNKTSAWDYNLLWEREGHRSSKGLCQFPTGFYTTGLFLHLEEVPPMALQKNAGLKYFHTGFIFQTWKLTSIFYMQSKFATHPVVDAECLNRLSRHFIQ